MIKTRRPLVEKMALFWHHLLATGSGKIGHYTSSTGQIELFRRVGMTDLRTVLTEVSKDPAMIYWLDNNENLKGEPNENYGRELLELFSMGAGNYTEDDIRAAGKIRFRPEIALTRLQLCELLLDHYPDSGPRRWSTWT